jgi:ACS family hexuronate transporter-like MFS transporter
LARRGLDGLAARKRILVGVACTAPLIALVPHVSGLAPTVALLSLAAVICLTWLLLLMPVIADTFPAGNVASVWAIAGAFGAVGAMVFNFCIGRLGPAAGGAPLFATLGVLHLGASLLLGALVHKVAPATRA